MSKESGTDGARSSRLDKATNVAIIVTLLFLLLNPSGVIGNWLGGQIGEARERRAHSGLWTQLAGLAEGFGTMNRSDARPIVIEFLDYQCPACRAVAPVVASAWENGTANIVIRHLPLERIHPLAREAAKAAVCAEWQGRLREAHDALLSEHDWISRQDWLGLAEAIGIGDLAQFADCLDGEGAEARVDADLRVAASLGISSTPTFVTERGVYRGARGFDAALHDASNGKD